MILKYIFRYILIFIFALLFPYRTVLAVDVTTVLTPNGGECLTVGQNYTITFSYSGSGIEHIALYYRTDGQQPAHLDSSTIKHPINVPQQGTSWSWKPTAGDISETGRVWIDGHALGHNSLNTWDSSNADFSVRNSCAPLVANETGGGGSVVKKVVLPPTIQTAEITAITTSAAIVVWATDRFSFTRLAYGTSTNNYSKEFAIDPIESRIKHAALLADLEANTKYYFKIITGAMGIEKKDESSEFTFTTLKPPDKIPPQPVNWLFTFNASSSAVFSWLNPDDNDFKKVIAIRRADRYAGDVVDGEVIFVGSENYFVDDKTENDQTYFYSFFAVDDSQNSSPPTVISATVTAGGKLPDFEAAQSATTTPPSARFLSSEPANNSVVLRWKNPEEKDFLGIQIVRNDQSLPAHPFDGEIAYRGREQFFENRKLINDQKYSFGVFTFDWLNNFSSGAFITDIPSMPIESLREEIKELKSKIAVKLTTPLKFGAEGEQVEMAQLLLDIPATGKFDEITRAAVKKFQADQDIVSGGDEISTGYGLIGPRTRARFKKLFGAVAVEEIKTIPKILHVVANLKDKYNPPSIVISQGDTVRWDNKDDQPTWMASDPHPVHTAYQDFDSLRPIESGESFSFTFTKRGRWTYHDHLNPQKIGKIIVK